MTNVVVLNSLEDVTRSLNNVTITVRLVWVDPAPSTSREHAIRTVCSCRSRSMRIVLWGFDDETKTFLQGHTLDVIKFEGLTMRQHREPYLTREHLFGAACNREDKFNMNYVGRYMVVGRAGEGEWADVIVQRPVLAQSGSVGSMTMVRSPSVLQAPSQSRDVVQVTPERQIRRAREWVCPNAGCLVSAWPFCMITGQRHPTTCTACGTQGIYRYCPATPRGGVPVLHEGMEPELVPPPAVASVLNLDDEN